MQADQVRVLYVGGSGRSGSTLLDNVLGQVDGLCSVGELRYVWERGMLDDRPCGCGEPFSRCPFWVKVLETAFPDGPPDAGAMVRAKQDRVRARRLPRLLRGGSAGEDDYTRALTRLYRAVAEVSGAPVVVDSSKLPPYGAVLQRLPAVDFAVVHLVRDPRATAWSWMRKRPLPDYQGARLMQRQPPWKAALLWSLWNLVAEVLWRRLGARYLRLRYEDLVAAPGAPLRAVCALAGVDSRQLPLRGEHAVELAPTHSVAGNPSRFASGLVPLQPDTEWTSAMSWPDRTVVTLLTLPLLLRYGYAVRGGKA